MTLLPPERLAGQRSRGAAGKVLTKDAARRIAVAGLSELPEKADHG
jgi:hypothetical protein